MAPKFRITDDVRDVLSRCTIDATSVKLPEQLPRDLYVRVDKVLKGAGGKWNRKAGVHLFERDPREALDLALETGEATNVKQALQAFYTPPEVAAQVVAVAGIEHYHTVLEPSAGLGALVDAVRAYGRSAAEVCVEIDPAAAAKLRERYAQVIEGDFLALTPEDLAACGAPFDRILMNPPFTKGQDIAHVTHALRFLKPGGRLVAITMPSWQRAETSAAREFRGLVEGPGYRVTRREALPAGAFAASGTTVETLLLVIEKNSAALGAEAPLPVPAPVEIHVAASRSAAARKAWETRRRKAA